LKKIVVGVIAGFVSVYSNKIDYEKMCTQALMQKNLDRQVLHSSCTYAAEAYKKESVLKYIYFNLLSGKYEKSLTVDTLRRIEDIKHRESKGNAYLLIGHSYALANKMKQAQKYYSKAVVLTQFSQRFYDYLKLPELYPDKQDQIKRINRLIKQVYQKREQVDRLMKDLQNVDPFSKKELELLTQLIVAYQKTFHTSPPMRYTYIFIEHLLKRKKYKEAIELLKKQPQTKKSLALMANAYKGMGAYMDAVKLFKKALSISKKSDKDLLQYHKAVADCYTKMGNYKVALLDYKNALKLVKKSDIDYSYLSLEIGKIYQKLKEYDRALYYYQKGLESHHNIVSLCSAKSEVYLKTGQLEKISDCYTKNAHWIEEDRDDELFELKSVIQLYQLQINPQENPKKGIALLEQIFLINKRFHLLEDDTLASLYSTAGSLYLGIKQYQKSLEYYKQALLIVKKQYGTRHEYTLTAYNNIAYLYSKLGQYKQAEKYFKQIPLQDDYIQLRYSVYSNLCSIMYRQKEKTRSVNKYCILAKKLAKRYPVKTHQALAGLLYESAATFFDNGDADYSLKYYKKALEVNIGLYGKSHLVVMKNFQEIAKWYQKHQLYAKAYRYALLGFKSFNKRKMDIFIGENREQKENFLWLNRQSIILLFNAGFENIRHNASVKERVANELLNAWLNYKGSIFDSENAIVTLYLNTKDKNLKADIKKLMNDKRDLAKLYQSIPKPKQREAWQKSIKELEANIDTLTKKIANKANSFKELQALKHISYQDIAKNLKESELYIDFAKSGDHYYIFTLDNKENINFIRVDKEKSKKIDSLVKDFREDIDVLLNKSLDDKALASLTQRSKEKLGKLYSIIFTPLQDIVKDKKSLTISPDGALKLLPFEALYNGDGSRYLIEEKNIKYIPSGKELVRLYRFNNQKLAKNETVIFDNPNFNAKTIKSKQKEKEEEVAITPNTSRAGIVKSLFKMHFNPLPGTKAEAQSIKQTLQDKVTIEEYKEEKATEANLLKVKQPNILHIATHGFFINDNTIPNPMLKSGIALSGANSGAKLGTGEGIVTALKLSGLQLKGTDLVVLSACQTGVVDINATDSVSGLSKAFIQAGAKDIVMSLWSVNDQATKELMSSFYKKVKTEPNYVKALKEAKLNMIKQNMHPFFWAPFVVSGL